MGEFLFGLGKGHQPAKANRIAKRHGARLVNYTDPGCGCGYGCTADCPALRRHWFVGPNHGEPFDGQLATAVIIELTGAGLIH